MAPWIRIALAALALAATAGAAAHGGAQPPALERAATAWEAGDGTRALALLAPALACDEPHALALAARIGEARGDGSAAGFWARAARMGHATAHVVLALERAREGTREGDVAASAHLVVRKWLGGLDEALEGAMRVLEARMAPQARTEAIKRARTVLRAIAKAVADNPCGGGAQWL